MTLEEHKALHAEINSDRIGWNFHKDGENLPILGKRMSYEGRDYIFVGRYVIKVSDITGNFVGRYVIKVSDITGNKKPDVFSRFNIV